MVLSEGLPVYGDFICLEQKLCFAAVFNYLDAPVERVTGADVPMPYTEPLEKLSTPTWENIYSAAVRTLEGSVG